MHNHPQICLYCCEVNSVRKHGLAASGSQRYYCMSCKKTYQVKYIYQANEINIQRQITALSDEGKSNTEISRLLGVSLRVVDRLINQMALMDSLNSEA
ncbi:MAG: hypothetical protein ACK5M5_03130 [Limnobaculum xujianqingii]